MAEKSEIELYKKQTRFLKESIKGSQLRHVELKKENQKLAHRNKTLKEDSKDISEYLLHCISNEEEEQELLRLIEQDQLYRQKKDDAMKLLLSKKREVLQEQSARIHSNSETLAQQKDEILQMKKQLKEQQESMEEKLKLEAEKHKTAIKSLQLELDSKIIKKHQETHDRINRKAEAREQDKVAQARQEVEDIQSMTEQMFHIVEEMASLKDRKNKFQKKIAKEKTFLLKLKTEISKLNMELKQLAMTCEAQEAKLTDGRMHLQRALATEETLKQKQAFLSQQLHQDAHESQQLDVELQKEKALIEELKKTMQKAADVLKATVKDFQNPGEARRTLQGLLQFLEGSHPGGPEPTPDESAQESSQEQDAITSRRLGNQETSAAQRD